MAGPAAHPPDRHVGPLHGAGGDDDVGAHGGVALVVEDVVHKAIAL